MKTEYSLILGWVLVLVASVARAQDADDITRQAGARIAITTCANCHGKGGNSISSKFPNLAGQRQNYLELQLKAFRGQTRGDPDALAFMWGMAAPLDDTMINALAQYYAAKKAAPGKTGDPAVIAKGKVIYNNGIPSQN